MWSINWIAVVAAALSAFLVGGLWYGPLFLKPWLRANGQTEETAQKGHAPTIFGLSFLLNLVSAFVLAQIYRLHGDIGLCQSILIALGVAIGFIVPAYGVNYLFAQRKLALFAIDAGYWIVTYALMGAVLGAFGG
ncbi:hypothetical protein ACFB49_32100 [Sphingomonas sp. DBB INV C78]|uniref:DUF1761 domain-containing protein n=1 Tax=Sphingomonas sp. DBB INV C78 TaxID=3349434 RepID=UPI0036D3717B